jgi:signal peptidase I
MLFTKKHKLRKELKILKAHAKHTLLVDDDILSDKQKEALREIEKASDNCDANSIEAMQKTIDKSSSSYRKILPPLKNAWIREYLDVLAVAVAVAFGIRGLFLQPFKIPTSSMQPTLFGIHYIAKDGQVNPLLGKVSVPLDYLLFSCEKAKLKIKKDGILEDNNSYGVFQQGMRYGFFPYTSFNIGGVNCEIPTVTSGGTTVYP